MIDANTRLMRLIAAKYENCDSDAIQAVCHMFRPMLEAEARQQRTFLSYSQPRDFND